MFEPNGPHKPHGAPPESSLSDLQHPGTSLTISRGLWDNLQLCRETLRSTALKGTQLLETLLPPVREVLVNPAEAQFHTTRLAQTAETVSKMLQAIDILDFILAPDHETSRGPEFAVQYVRNRFGALKALCEDFMVNDCGAARQVSPCEVIDGSLGALYRRHREEITALALQERSPRA